MKKKVYQELASRLVALRNCNESGNEEWADKHEDRINEITAKHLPSGSGIDSGNEFDLSRSTPDKLVIESGYHVRYEFPGNGFYNGWIDYMVIVEPSLQFGCTVSIRGKFGKRQDIKEYLEEIYTDAIHQEI